MSISAANKVRRGDIRHAVVVRTNKKLQRPDGSVVKFDDNACVLINKGGEPIGSRLNGELDIHGDLETGQDNEANVLAQELLEASYETSSGRRSCLWLQCTCRIPSAYLA